MTENGNDAVGNQDSSVKDTGILTFTNKQSRFKRQITRILFLLG